MAGWYEDGSEEEAQAHRKHVQQPGAYMPYVAAKTGSPEKPEYRKVEEYGTTPTFMIVCDEGWRESIVCTRMYGWAADWLIGQIQGKPFPKSSSPVPSSK
jgi:hypothetical protein